VGVACEQSLEDAMSAAKADCYCWLNLVDINDKYNIWDKYDMKNSSGDIFSFRQIRKNYHLRCLGRWTSCHFKEAFCEISI